MVTCRRRYEDCLARLCLLETLPLAGGRDALLCRRGHVDGDRVSAQAGVQDIAAVYLAHAMAMRVYTDKRAALRSQYPMLLLMID